MDIKKIIKKHYNSESIAYHFLIEHSKMVTDKAIQVAEMAKHLTPDFNFIQEAAMLHDIGIFLTNEQKIGCYGDNPYICHGYLGREILEKESLPRHALVCERHVGIGISLKDIEEKNLPLPKRDMRPVSLEEQIICFADNFFSKDPKFLLKEKSLEQVRTHIEELGIKKLKTFDEWILLFNYK